MKHILKSVFYLLKTNLSEFGNYRIGANVYPKPSSIDQTNNRSKKRGVEFDLPIVILKNGKTESILTVETNIENIDKIKLFLYDKDKYSGIIGKPIWIKGL